jgi:hypothetical protein
MDWSNYAAMILLVVMILIGVGSSLIIKIIKKKEKGMALMKCFSLVDNFEKIINVSKDS